MNILGHRRRNWGGRTSGGRRLQTLHGDGELHPEKAVVPDAADKVSHASFVEMKLRRSDEESSKGLLGRAMLELAL